MRSQRFSLDAIEATPWKNGAGMTQEIACWPQGAGIDDFDWRVSIATIDASGPFSQFAGVDRQIMLLGGCGMHLRAHDGTVNHRLDKVLQPYAFPGEVQIDCQIFGGVSRDFNVMTRRSRCGAELKILDKNARFEHVKSAMVLVLQGHWTIDADPKMRAHLTAGEGLYWTESVSPFKIETMTQPENDAHCILVIFS